MTRKKPPVSCGGCGREITFEPGQLVGDPEAVDAVKALMAERDRLREALDNLAYAAREFNTAAAYRVESGIEDEFITALEAAEQIVAVDAGEARP